MDQPKQPDTGDYYIDVVLSVDADKGPLSMAQNITLRDSNNRSVATQVIKVDDNSAILRIFPSA